MQPQSIIVVSCATAAGRRREACRSARTNGTAAHGASNGCQWPRFMHARWERGLTFVCGGVGPYPRHRSLTPSPTVWACSARWRRRYFRLAGGRRAASNVSAMPAAQVRQRLRPGGRVGWRRPRDVVGCHRYIWRSHRFWTVFSTKIAGRNHF